ncbi:DNA-binding IclR family transcriptional regulator [Geodermatophilus bullaregiensis]|uniref:IclR family transcriptional regulator n=1 Tax=Geodermatophilus bullaregiensis TaxID=1564160 RepID=UPI001958273D|nr:IclR family transcriptional regulator [Geodermatophilus bullaregiensis]MBM7804459.1 DNA-binding IclR family transcriptional regulator [Geodermatophilus bullaregiensis]
MAADDGTGAPQSQTLDRGLRILEHLATVAAAQPVAEVAQSVGLHRSIAYRLLRTLEDHQLVERDPAGHYRLGLGMAALARGVRTDLQTAALPQLDALAADLGMTAFLVVRAGDEAVTVTSIEPQTSSAHVAYRPGIRHPVGRGAPGLALLIPEPARSEDRRELTEARSLGWATSHGEVVPGFRSVAAPVLGPDGGVRGALAVVFVDDAVDPTEIGPAVVAAAAQVGLRLR